MDMIALSEDSSMAMDKHTFREQLQIALNHIRDVVHLRTMPLATVLVPAADVDERGWELARYLLAAIENLQPSIKTDDPWPALRYELLVLRYVNGLHPEQAADEMNISQRHLYRLLKRALNELSEYLWIEASSRLSPEARDSNAAMETERALLHQESTKFLHAVSELPLAEILDNVLRVLTPLFNRRRIHVARPDPVDLPSIQANAELIRQLLLGLLGRMLGDEQLSLLRLVAWRTDSIVRLKVLAGTASSTNDVTCFAHLDEDLLHLAHIQGLTVEAIHGEEGWGFRLDLPLCSQGAILVVDDNEEVGLLFQRYMFKGGYTCVTATTGAEAIALARSRSFCAATVDLMMSQEDGWDVLQALRHLPETQDLPIIVCSVLDQAELALMLGASAFLRKPIRSETLLATLARLRRCQNL